MPNSSKQQSTEKNLNHEKTTTHHSETEDTTEFQSISILQTVCSILSAMIGVQSQTSHQRDFKKGNTSTFIVVGICMIIILIFVLIQIVGTVLNSAGVH